MVIHVAVQPVCRLLVSKSIHVNYVYCVTIDDNNFYVPSVTATINCSEVK